MFHRVQKWPQEVLILASNTGRSKWQDTEMRLARASGRLCAVESMATLRSGGRGKGGRVKSQRLAIAISLAFPKARKKGSRGRAKALELV